MQWLDLTYNDPALNLALDEALLEHAEADECAVEVIRVWEPEQPMVVLGRSSPYQREVNLEFCQRNSIPILRRCSGGATIVTGPGCLMYAVRMNYRDKENLRMLDAVHSFVLNEIKAAISRLGIATSVQGTSDLTLGDRKFSGNSLRCKKNGFVYHGTLICDFDLAWVSNCLDWPERQPEYRRARHHTDFLTGLPVSVDEVKQALAEQWQPKLSLETPTPSLEQMTKQLAKEKYSLAAWTEKV